MKKIHFLLGFLLCLTGAQAQIGTVLNSENNQPLPNVVVITEGSVEFRNTNTKGQVDLSAFSNAENLEFRLLGFKTQYISYSAYRDAGYVIAMSPILFNLDQVVISSNKRLERDRLIPNRIRKIGQNAVILANPQTAADLLGNSGEVYIQKSQQGGGSPMIRGFGTNRVLISVDGVRMNTAIFRSGNLQNVISIDPFAVQSTEVIFGPGSVIYGSDAIGAVMSFQTLAPQLSLDEKVIVSGSVVARAASVNNELATHFDVSVAGKKWGSTTSFSFTEFGDLKMGRFGPDEYLRTFNVERIDSSDVVVNNPDPEIQLGSGYSQSNLMQKIRFRPNNVWDLEYALHYSTTGDVPRYDRLNTLRNGKPRDAEWYYGPQVWLMNHLSANYTKSNNFFDAVSIDLAVQNFEESRINRNFNSADKFARTENVVAYSGNIDFTKLIGNGQEITYGAEVVFNDVNSKGIVTDINTGVQRPANSRYPQSTWASYAAYVAYRQSLGENTTLHAGARYNSFIIDAQFDTSLFELPFNKAVVNDGALTGSIGLVHETDNGWWFKLTGSTGFRAPNVDDLGKIFDPADQTVVVPNANLKAEYAWNGEISIIKSVSDIFKVELTGYYTLLSDALVIRDFQLNGQDSIIFQGEVSKVKAIQNASSADVLGAQVAIDLKLTKNFGFHTRFNYQAGNEELDNGDTAPLRHVAPWFGLSGLTYRNGSTLLELSADYNGEVRFENFALDEGINTSVFPKDKNGNPYSPSWYRFNFRVMTQLNPTWSVSGGVDNFTNQRYRQYRSGIAAGGRNIVLSLRASF